jgi:hypothetical protein
VNRADRLLNRAIIRGVIVICLTAAAANGGAQTIEPPHIAIPRVSGTPHRSDFESMERLDGPLGMRRIEGFLQRFPNDGEPVSERTIVYVGYDAEFLYVAFQCFDAGSAVFGSVTGSGRRFNYELDYNDRSPTFRVVDGFVPRVDLRSVDQTFANYNLADIDPQLVPTPLGLLRSSTLHNTGWQLFTKVSYLVRR